MPEKNLVCSALRVIVGDIVPLNVVYREGLYHLYYSSGTTVARLVSADLINWKDGGDLVTERFPFVIGTGSAIFRNGRTFVLYGRSGIKSDVRIVSSRNGVDFEKHPLPAIGGNPKARHPRVFYSDGAYYMLTADKGIHLYRSDNLFDWEYSIELLAKKADIKYLSPSIVRLGGKNFIIYGEQNKKTREESAYIAECKIDIESRYFSLFSQPKLLPILFPRTSTLQDGRVILSGFIKESSQKTTILQEIDYQNGIVYQPLRELRDKRRNSRMLVATVIDKASYQGIEAEHREITAETLLNSADSIEINVGDTVTVSYQKSSGAFSLDAGSTKVTSNAGSTEKVNLDIIAANGLCEVYFNDCFLALPLTARLSQTIEISVAGSAVVDLCEYTLDLN